MTQSLVSARSRYIAGAVGVVAIAAALALPGVPPRTTDHATALVEIVTTRHVAIRLGTWLAGAGLVLFLWFLGAVYADVSERGDRAAAFTAAAGGVAAGLLLIVGMAMTTGVSLVAPPDSRVTKSMIDVGNVVIDLSKFGFGTLVWATCAGTPLSRRLRASGIAAAIIVVISAVSGLASDRTAFQFGGPIDVFGSVPATAWLVWFAISRAGRRAEARA